MATLDDVAKRSRVSAMTVSRVINNRGAVSDETRYRVLEAIKELNYRPNLIARGLATNKTNSIGVLVSRLENPVYAVMVSGINSCAGDHGMDIILGSGNSERRLMNGVNTLLNKQIDGLVVLPVEIFNKENGVQHYNLEAMDRFYREFQNLAGEISGQGIPVVIVGDYDIQGVSGNVREDYGAGARMAVHYLFSRGHRHIGMVSHQVQDMGIWGERYRGFLDGMSAVGCEVSPTRMESCMDTVDDAYEAGLRLAARSGLPTALYCANDIIAVGVMNALRDCGIRVPEDISVIGHDGSLYSEIANPRLTTVSIQPFEIGRVCMEQIISRVHGQEAPALEMVQPKIIEGKSVADRTHVKTAPITEIG